MLMTCPKCGQLTKGQTGDQCSKCKIFLRPAAEMGELQQRRERMRDEPSVDEPEEASLRKCPKCGAVEGAKSAKFCSRCGAALPDQSPAVKQTPKNSPLDLFAGYFFLGVIGLAIVAGVFNFFVDQYKDYQFEKEMEEWREANPYTTDDIYDEIEDDYDSGYTYHTGSTDVPDDYKLALYMLAQDEVKKQLKSPSTAKFPSTYLSSDISYTHLGDDYVITSWVEAENSYGAMLRQTFMVSANISGGRMSDIICIVG